MALFRHGEKLMPLTKRTKEILEGKQTFESKIKNKRLTVKAEDRWRAQKKAQSTAKQALEDLLFLARTKPELLIDNSQLIELIKTLMDKGKIEDWERHVNRLPAELGGHSGINGKGYYQIGGVVKQKYGKADWLHGSSVALRKPLITAKLNLGKTLIQTIFDSFASIFFSESTLIIKIMSAKERINVETSTKLEVIAEKKKVLHINNAQTMIHPEVTEEISYVAELPLISDDLSRIKIIVLEKLD
jgi:hypothetical protein